MSFITSKRSTCRTQRAPRLSFGTMMRSGPCGSGNGLPSIGVGQEHVAIGHQRIELRDRVDDLVAVFRFRDDIIPERLPFQCVAHRH
jgi:hypothetical protein